MQWTDKSRPALHAGVHCERRCRPAAAALSCLAVSLCLAACATDYTAFDIDRKLSMTLGAAQYHTGIQEFAEATQLVSAIERIDPDYPGLDEVRARLDTEAEDLFAESAIGANRARRYGVQRPMLSRVLRYLPDRLGDLLDIVTIDAHSGFGGFADVHLTRAVQFVGGARVVGGLGSYPMGTGIGFQLQAEAGAHALGIGQQRFRGFIAGPAGVFSGSSNLRGAHRPSDRFYQDYRDFWAIGLSGTLGIVGGGLDLHPVQVADFVAGFFGIDFANDDSAHTRPLRLLISERELLQELARIESNPDLVELYLRNRERLLPP